MGFCANKRPVSEFKDACSTNCNNVPILNAKKMRLRVTELNCLLLWMRNNLCNGMEIKFNGFIWSLKNKLYRLFIYRYKIFKFTFFIEI